MGWESFWSTVAFLVILGDMTETSYALYRKYRPETFGEVRNQDHIVKVLEGSLKKGLIPHALLFTGSRGTGKTTVARIFAKAIGAEDIDVYEIDAASNRGIDDIRALKEAVYTLPFKSPYKVYIIDEVHMLSKDAANALLKTLEEPPEYVVFILATTEQDKILDTIVSRCQVFTFRAPTREELTLHILDVAKSEKLKITEAGASVIALAAHGSYRDGLSIMQKVLMASADEKLSEDEIAVIIGAPKGVIILEFLEALEGKSSERALIALTRALTERVDIRIFLSLTLERIRAIMLLRHRAIKEDELSEFYPDERAFIIRAAGNKQSPINSSLLLRFLHASAELGNAHIPTLPLELAVIDSIS